MSVILKIDPSKKDIIINNNHNGITINNNNVSKRKFPVSSFIAGQLEFRRNVVKFREFVMKTGSLCLMMSRHRRRRCVLLMSKFRASKNNPTMEFFRFLH